MLQHAWDVSCGLHSNREFQLPVHGILVGKFRRDFLTLESWLST